MDTDDIMARSYGLLRGLQWEGWEDGKCSCPCCHSFKYTGGHNHGCELAAILATEDDWKAHIARRDEILAQEGTNTP